MSQPKKKIVITVYVIRDNVLGTHEVHEAIFKVFRAWAADCQDFNGVNYTALSSWDSVAVSLYPEQEVEGTWFKERSPDEVATPSPFFLEKHELTVFANVVPAACSIVAFVGEQTMEQYRKHDIDYAIDCAWCGCSYFEVAEIASDCDGFVGLYRSTIDAAANLPDTGMDSTEVLVDDADNIALLVNLNRDPSVELKVKP